MDNEARVLLATNTFGLLDGEVNGVAYTCQNLFAQFGANARPVDVERSALPMARYTGVPSPALERGNAAHRVVLAMFDPQIACPHDAQTRAPHLLRKVDLLAVHRAAVVQRPSPLEEAAMDEEDGSILRSSNRTRSISGRPA